MKHLRRLRRQLGVAQGELAKRIPAPQSLVCLYEGGFSRISSERQKQILKALTQIARQRMKAAQRFLARTARPGVEI